MVFNLVKNSYQIKQEKPSACGKSESRESFIREDAARKHKMRPPTAPEYQPYEFAEIQYNPTFNDPNVEVFQSLVFQLL